MKSLRISAITAVLLASSTSVGTARAQTTIMISTESPPATPRLQSPFTAAGTPATPFLFSLPATGQAPLTFSATGLPSGLVLDPATGIISGTTPAAGSYPIAVSVSNASGSASATYVILAGNTLAPTPPMGWNSYDSFGASVTEDDMIDQGEAVRTLLTPFGWHYVVIDYRWYEPGQPLDANGRYLPATSKYPSATGNDGFKSLADRIHARGLRFGIHIMRGVPRKAYDADLPIAGSTHTTRDAGNPDDPCPWDTHMWGVRGDTEAGQAWYDALMQQYASWGVDFIKIDDMLNNTTRTYHQAEADAIHRAVAKTGRAIALSFSPGPDDPSWLPNSIANLNQNASMWRVVNDFWDFNALTDLPGVFRAASTWQGVEGLAPGHWPDLDMLPLGYLGPRNEWHASGQTTFSRNEQVSIMTLWSMLPSPLMFGGNPARLADDEWTLALLTNEEVLAVNQDVLGLHGKRRSVDGGEIWTRDLNDGAKAVAFFNRGTQDATMSATLAEIGIEGELVIRDVWRRADASADGGALSANVPGEAAVLFTLSPPASDGTGGMGGMSGAAGSGAAGGGAASGGGAGTPGAAGVAAGGGGASGAGGVAGATASGGGGMGGSVNGAGGGGSSSMPAGGASGVTGSGGGTSAIPADDAGCGCTVPGRAHRGSELLLMLASAALGLMRRRRAF